MIYVIISITNNTVVNVIKSDAETPPDLSAMHYDWQLYSLKDSDAPEGLSYGWVMKSLGKFEPPDINKLKETTSEFLKTLFSQILEDHPDAPQSLLNDALKQVQDAKTLDEVASVTIVTELRPKQLPTETPPKDLTTTGVTP